MRQGRGYCIHKDGSLLEGHWKNNELNGRGRKISIRGDVYVGEWKDNKCHGIGKYMHKEGYLYSGFIKELSAGKKCGLERFIEKRKQIERRY
jgi:hypothetical protein